MPFKPRRAQSDSKTSPKSKSPRKCLVFVAAVASLNLMAGVAEIQLFTETASAATTTPPGAAATKRACVYSRHSIAALKDFGRTAGKAFTCALVYNDAAPDWANWANPWFVKHVDLNLNWAKWVKARPGRQLIITQSMIPSNAPADWRYRGARGEYDANARTLASNLVRSGLGSSVIRLGHEANGTWYKHSIGTTQADFDAWKRYWGAIVRAMRSVPGANFTFDWCINAGYRPIPYASYYPGDSVVDVIGGDIYDVLATNMTATTLESRWSPIYTQKGGMSELLAFAKAHGKPLSIPEWAVVANGVKLGGGDNPHFVNAIAGLVKYNRVAYQSYFLSPTGGVGMVLTDAPKSLAAYKAQFIL